MDLREKLAINFLKTEKKTHRKKRDVQGDSCDSKQIQFQFTLRL